MTLVYLVLALVALGVAFFAGRKTAPAPKQKVFGVDAAKRMRAQLGGSLAPGQGKIAQIAAAVGDLLWTLPDELKALRDGYAAAKAAGLARIAQLRKKVASTEAEVAAVEASDAETVRLGAEYDA